MEKQEILAALRGEVAIPVYATEEGVKRYFICSLAYMLTHRSIYS